MSGTDIISQGKVIGAIRQAAGLSGDYAPVLKVRELAGLAPADFDAAAIALYAARVIDLVPQSCQMNLTVADRAAAVAVGGEAKHRAAWAA